MIYAQIFYFGSSIVRWNMPEPIAVPKLQKDAKKSPEVPGSGPRTISKVCRVKFYAERIYGRIGDCPSECTRSDPIAFSKLPKLKHQISRYPKLVPEPYRRVHRVQFMPSLLLWSHRQLFVGLYPFQANCDAETGDGVNKTSRDA